MYIRTEAHMDARTIMHAQVCEKFKVIAPDVDHAGPMWVIFAAGFLTGALMLHVCMHACVHACVRANIHAPHTRALKIRRAVAGACVHTCMHKFMHTY